MILKRKFLHFRGGGGGHHAPEPQDVQSEARAGPKTVLEDNVRNSGKDRRNFRSPIEMLVNTVSHTQRDLAMLRDEHRALGTPATPRVIKAGFAPKACERFTARFDERQTFVYAILKHSALFNAIRLLNLFHHNTKIPERNILFSITTKLTIRATSKTHATLTSPLVRIQL